MPNQFPIRIIVPIYWFRSLSSFEFSIQTIDSSCLVNFHNTFEIDISIVRIENSKEESDLNQ